MTRLKIASLVVVAILLVIIIAQNTALVRVNILFATVEMAVAALLAVTLLIGFVMGVGVAGWMIRRGRLKAK